MKLRQKFLSDSDLELITSLHQSPEWRVLSKLLDNEIVNLYKVAVTSPDIETLANYNGQIYQLRKIKTEVKRIATKFDREKKKGK